MNTINNRRKFSTLLLTSILMAGCISSNHSPTEGSNHNIQPPLMSENGNSLVCQESPSTGRMIWHEEIPFFSETGYVTDNMQINLGYPNADTTDYWVFFMVHEKEVDLHWFDSEGWTSKKFNRFPLEWEFKEIPTPEGSIALFVRTKNGKSGLLVPTKEPCIEISNG